MTALLGTVNSHSIPLGISVCIWQVLALLSRVDTGFLPVGWGEWGGGHGYVSLRKGNSLLCEQLILCSSITEEKKWSETHLHTRNYRYIHVHVSVCVYIYIYLWEGKELYVSIDVQCLNLFKPFIPVFDVIIILIIVYYQHATFKIRKPWKYTRLITLIKHGGVANTHTHTLIIDPP